MEQTSLQDAIRERAYVIWQEQGRPNGRDVQNWLQAETELTATAAVSKTTSRKTTTRRRTTTTRRKKAS